jgi:hypothetical protein
MLGDEMREPAHRMLVKRIAARPRTQPKVSALVK